MVQASEPGFMRGAVAGSTVREVRAYQGTHGAGWETVKGRNRRVVRLRRF